MKMEELNSTLLTDKQLQYQRRFVKHVYRTVRRSRAERFCRRFPAASIQEPLSDTGDRVRCLILNIANWQQAIAVVVEDTDEV